MADNFQSNEIAIQGELINQLMETADRAVNEDEKDDNELAEPLDPSSEDHMIGASSIEGGGIVGDNDNNNGNNDDATTTAFNVPKLSQWEEKEIDDDDVAVTVTVGLALRRLWRQGKKEISILKRNIEAIRTTQDQTNNRSEIYSIFTFLFGTKSIFCETLRRHLPGLSELDYLRFLTTYFSSCQSQMSLPLKNYSKAINCTNFLEQQNYNLIWAQILALGGSQYSNPLWIMIEDTTNKTLKSLFMGGNDNEKLSYILDIDDNKLHFNYGHNSDMNNLKSTHHIRDNRKGFTLHTAAFSATCVLVAIMYQRDEKSVQDMYLQILKF